MLRDGFEVAVRIGKLQPAILTDESITFGGRDLPHADTDSTGLI